jgi:hypothetical protein
MPERTTPRAENPRRLALLLVEIRQKIFQLKQAEMAKLLQHHTRRDRDDEPVVAFSQSVLASIENRQIGFRFAHLEAYARALGMPTGILLLVSWYSTTSDPVEDLAQFQELLRRFDTVCEEAKRQKRRLEVDDLRALANIVTVEPPFMPDPLTEEDLPSDASNLQRLRRARQLANKRGIDPLDGADLFSYRTKREES